MRMVSENFAHVCRDLAGGKKEQVLIVAKVIGHSSYKRLPRTHTFFNLLKKV